MYICRGEAPPEASPTRLYSGADPPAEKTLSLAKGHIKPRADWLVKLPMKIRTFAHEQRVRTRQVLGLRHALNRIEVLSYGQ